MDPTEQVPLLSQTTTRQSTNTDPQQATDSSASHWTPSEAELLVLHPSDADPSNMFGPLRRLFLPKFTPAQLLQFFNRPAGPRQVEASFTIRPARFSDVPQQAMLQARADWEMPAMRIFHPLKDVFPEDYLRGFWEGDLMYMCKKGAWTYVAVAVAEKGEEVIGEIRFSRQGDGKRGAKRQHGWVGMIVDYAMRVYMRLFRSSWIKPLRSTKMATESQKNAAQRTTGNFETLEQKYWTGELKERFYVATVCVKDEWRGRGVGKALMAIATEACERERLPLTLSATEDGVHLYRKMGFVGLEGYELPGGGVGAHYEFMVWDPRKRG